MLRGMFEQSNAYTKLVMALIITLLMIFLSEALAMLIVAGVYHLDTNNFTAIFQNPTDPASIPVLKYFQIFQALFGFVFSALLLAYIFSSNMHEYLSLDINLKFILIILTILIISVAYPLINSLAEWNSHFHLPAFMKGFENYLTHQDQENERVMEAFLGDTNIRGLVLNIFMIGILTAIGEELVFRGIFQKVFTQMTKNYHWGIWITAIFFSLVHMQISGFLPRMLLGALFGYLLVWSGSIWIPILAHFFNNTSDVIIYFFVNTGRVDKNTLNYGSTAESWPWVVFSVFGTILLIYLFYKKTQSGIPGSPDQAISE